MRLIAAAGANADQQPTQAGPRVQLPIFRLLFERDALSLPLGPTGKVKFSKTAEHQASAHGNAPVRLL